MAIKLTNSFKLLAASLGLVLTLLPQTAWAASASVRLSPASGSVAKGRTIVIGIRENSGGDPVNAAAATLSYPADKFDFVGISNSGAFGIAAASSGGGGSVHVDRGALPAVSGDQLIASVTLRAKVNSGSAAVSIAGAEIRSANDSSVIPSSVSGGNYSFTDVPAAPAAAPKDTVPPQISDVKAINIYTNYALITWTTSEPSSSEVLYGPTQGYGLSAVDPNPVTAHSVKLSSPLMVGGTVYHFMVKSVDTSGNAATSADNSFKTRGGTLLITVLNQHKKGVSGAVINIGDVKGTTNKKGQVTLKDVPYGKQNGTVTYKGQDTAIKPNVEGPDDLQPLTLKIKTPSNTVWYVAAGLAVLAALLLLGRGGKGPAAGLWAKLSGRPGAASGPSLSPKQQTPAAVVTPQSKL
jgi:hypothetical protein